MLLLEDNPNDSVQGRMMRWALLHTDEWDIVLGIADADAERVMLIVKLLSAAGFAELPELMAMKAYRLLSDTGGSDS